MLYIIRNKFSRTDSDDVTNGVGAATNSYDRSDECRNRGWEVTQTIAHWNAKAGCI